MRSHHFQCPGRVLLGDIARGQQLQGAEILGGDLQGLFERLPATRNVLSLEAELGILERRYLGLAA